MQDEFRDRLKVIAKVHRAFDGDNFLFLRINTDVSQDRAVQALAAFTADEYTDTRFAIDYLEQSRGSNLGRSTGIHGPAESKLAIA